MDEEFLSKMAFTSVTEWPIALTGIICCFLLISNTISDSTRTISFY